MDLKGKNILITGGARIGQFVAIELAKKGSNVFMTYRTSPEKIEGILKQVKSKYGVNTGAYKVDLTKQDQVKSLRDQIVKDHQQIHGCVFMASTFEGKDFFKTTDDELQAMLDGNIKATFFCVQALGEHMVQKGTGRIVLFGDAAAEYGKAYKGYAAYLSAKISVNGLTDVFAKELAPKVLVNAILPGPVLKPESMTDKEWKKDTDLTLLIKAASPEDIAKVVILCLETDSITGVKLRVDCGKYL